VASQRERHAAAARPTATSGVCRCSRTSFSARLAQDLRADVAQHNERHTHTTLTGANAGATHCCGLQWMIGNFLRHDKQAPPTDSIRGAARRARRPDTHDSPPPPPAGPPARIDDKFHRCSSRVRLIFGGPCSRPHRPPTAGRNSFLGCCLLAAAAANCNRALGGQRAGRVARSIKCDRWRPAPTTGRPHCWRPGPARPACLPRMSSWCCELILGWSTARSRPNTHAAGGSSTVVLLVQHARRLLCVLVSPLGNDDDETDRPTQGAGVRERRGAAQRKLQQ
jgi:hypothetical protein